jgi:hypothetical protein
MSPATNKPEQSNAKIKKASAQPPITGGLIDAFNLTQRD